MKIRISTLLGFATAVGMAALFPVSASAGIQMFDFSYSVSGPFESISASGVLDVTTPAVGGAYTVTNATGSWDYSNIFVPGTTDYSITGIDTTLGADNLLYVTAPFLDTSGLAFLVPGGGDALTGTANVYYSGSGSSYCETTDTETNCGTFTVSPAVAGTPEPATLSLLGAGLLALPISLLRRKRRA